MGDFHPQDEVNRPVPGSAGPFFPSTITAMPDRLEASPGDRRLQSMVLTVAQALDLLKIPTDQRRAVRERWRRAGWINDGQVDLAKAGPRDARSIAATTPARAKPKPVQSRPRTPEQQAAEVDRQFRLRMGQPSEAELEAEERTVRRRRAFDAIARRCGHVYG